MVLRKVLPWIIVAAASALMACGEEEQELTDEEKMAFLMENCISVNTG